MNTQDNEDKTCPDKEMQPMQEVLYQQRIADYIAKAEAGTYEISKLSNNTPRFIEAVKRIIDNHKCFEAGWDIELSNDYLKWIKRKLV